MNKVVISIRTKVDTSAEGLGRAFLSLLAEHQPSLLPELVGRSEPPKISVMNMDECLALWTATFDMRVGGSLTTQKENFHWRRKKKQKANGVVRHTTRNNQGMLVPGMVSITSPWSAVLDWSKLFQDLCALFPPQIGMLHLFSDNEWSSNDTSASFKAGSFKAALAPRFPGIPWMGVFDEEMATNEMIQHISSSVPLQVAPNGYGSFQLSEELDNLLEPEHPVHDIRARLMNGPMTS